MNKHERLLMMKKLKPTTWYAFCMLEALHEEHVKITRTALGLKLDVSQSVLSKYMTTWTSHGLVKETDGGIIIAQLDGQQSGVTEEPVVRQFKNARDIVNFWCDCYQEVYGSSYMISNWAMAQSQVKKLLVYPDAEIRGTLLAAITLYDRMWAKPSYPRPTLGALCSWLYQQAQPYAVVTTDTTVTEASEDHSNLLEEMEAKGWL